MKKITRQFVVIQSEFWLIHSLSRINHSVSSLLSIINRTRLRIHFLLSDLFFHRYSMRLHSSSLWTSFIFYNAYSNWKVISVNNPVHQQNEAKKRTMRRFSRTSHAYATYAIGELNVYILLHHCGLTGFKFSEPVEEDPYDNIRYNQWIKTKQIGQSG